MNQLDVLFRALTEYRKNTKDDKDCITQRTAIISSNSQQDIIEVTRNTCRIEEDWIQAIENGLEFIEKCIKEERQFIRSNGEVIPIEKVKRVSKDSVEHLAKHSDLLTREPEDGESIIPDNLYTVERLSDFAVYENRFLYMLLCYLRDFVGMRYERILELTNTYNGSMRMTKTVVESNRRVEYNVSLVEEKKNDEYLREHNEAQENIDRMLGIYKAIVHFLNTPLMNEVSKAPMIKPPVTRTNVLRMNKNFRQALALYEYITAYDKDGYEIIVDKKTLSPFTGIVADEIVESVEMSSFLTYEHGLGIREHFKRNYDKEEARKKEEERTKFAEQLNTIRRHLKQWEKTPEEYIALLEKRIFDLESREDELSACRTELDELYSESEKLKFSLKNSKGRIKYLEDELINLNHKYEEDMQAERTRHAEELKATIEAHETEKTEIFSAHAQEIEQLKQSHQEEIEQINQAHQSEIEQLNETYNAQIQEINLAHEKEVAEINDARERMKQSFEQEIDNRNKIIENQKQEIADIVKKEQERKAQDEKVIEELKASNKCLEDKKVISDARLYAIRSEYGLIKEDEDFSSEEMTDELEHQYLVFKKFFKTEWKKTKKVIKKEVFAKVKKEEQKRIAEKEADKNQKQQNVETQIEQEKQLPQEQEIEQPLQEQVEEVLEQQKQTTENQSQEE